MIGDLSFEFSKNQAITGASAFSTKFTDLGETVARDIGAGEPATIVFHVTEAFATATGTPLLTFNLVLDFSDTVHGVAFTLVGSSVQYGTAELGLGRRIFVPIMPLSDAQRETLRTAAGVGAPYKFLGASYVLAGGTFNAGKITAFLTNEPVSALQSRHFGDNIRGN